jgi:hypothetical protein
LEYKYQGANSRIKRQMPEMAMRSSGTRDIANVLKISAVTVLLVGCWWFKTQTEPTVEGSYDHVILDEFWSRVGQRKTGKRWVWSAYCGDTEKIGSVQR